MSDSRATSSPSRAADLIGAEAANLFNAAFARQWWLIALRGGAAIVFGLIALMTPGPALLSLVVVFAVYMLADGVFAMAAGIRAARRRERWGPMVLEGVVDILAGVIALAAPIATVVVFVVLIAGWAVLSGALMVGSAIRLKRDHGRWWLGLGGLASIAFGVLLLLAPLAGAVVLTWWLGAYALVFGAAMLVLAVRLHAHRREAHGTLAHGSA